MSATHYEISVWNWEGDVVRKFWDASEEDLQDLRVEFDDGFHTVVIDREWEEEPANAV